MTSFINRIFNHLVQTYWPFSSYKRAREILEENEENFDYGLSPPKRFRRQTSSLIPRTLREVNQPTVTRVRSSASVAGGYKFGEISFRAPVPRSPPPSFSPTETIVLSDDNEEPMKNSSRSARRSFRTFGSSQKPIESVDLTADDPQRKSERGAVQCIDLTGDDPPECIPNGSLSWRHGAASWRSGGSRRKAPSSSRSSRSIPQLDLTSPGGGSGSRHRRRRSSPAAPSPPLGFTNSPTIDLEERMTFGRLLGSFISDHGSPPPPSTPLTLIDLSQTDDEDVGIAVGESSSSRSRGRRLETEGSSSESSDVIQIIPQTSTSGSGKRPAPPDISTSTRQAIEKETKIINSFEEKIKIKPFTQSSVDDIWKKYHEGRDEFLKTKEKYEREALMWDEENQKMLNALLEEKLMRSLKITEALIPETPEEPFPGIIRPLPELTPGMQSQVRNALSRGHGELVLIDKYGYKIKKKDIMTLNGHNWLNDEVINFYLVLIMKRSEEIDNYPSVYVFSTFFYESLQKRGHDGVKRWTKKVNLFEKEIIIIPIHLQVHWCLLTIDLKRKEISYYDSMGKDNNHCLKVVCDYLKTEHKVKQESELDLSDFKIENIKDIPQQMNGSDCGVFACTYAEYSARRAPFSFNQTNMPYFRQKMIYEIINGELL